MHLANYNPRTAFLLGLAAFAVPDQASACKFLSNSEYGLTWTLVKPILLGRQQMMQNLNSIRLTFSVDEIK